MEVKPWDLHPIARSQQGCLWLGWMQWKEIVQKLDRLLDDLTQMLPQAAVSSRRAPTDVEKSVDQWVRKYVRSQQMPLPPIEVVSQLLIRVTYAATFARLAPRQEVEMPVSKAAEVVQVLMIDLWHGCFRQKWGKSAGKEEVAFAE